MTAPAYEGSISSLYGMPIKEVPYLSYDEMIISRRDRALLVGETAHFQWRVRVAAENLAVQMVARAHIVASWEKILGEPYPDSE